MSWKGLRVRIVGDTVAGWQSRAQHSTAQQSTPHHTTPHHTTLDSPSPPGRCARLLEEDGSAWALQKAPNTPWAGLPVPPRPVRPVLRG